MKPSHFISKCNSVFCTVGDDQISKEEKEKLRNLNVIKANLTREIGTFNMQAEEYQSSLREAREDIVRGLEEIITMFAKAWCLQAAKGTSEHQILDCPSFKRQGQVCQASEGRIVEDLELFDTYLKVSLPYVYFNYFRWCH